MSLVLKFPTAWWWSGVFFLSVLLSGTSVANPVIDWTNVFLESVRKDSTPPAQVSRRLAILFLASRDAHSLGQNSFFPDTPRPADPDTNSEIAAVGALIAGAEVFYPSHRPVYRSFFGDFKEACLASGTSTEDLTVALKYGREVVFASLKNRADDGSSSRQTFIPKIEPGSWRRTPPDFRPPELSHWGEVRPFLLDDSSQFRAPPPPSLDSAGFQKALEEVRTLGGKKEKGEAKEVAEFWSCFSYTSTPSGHWNVILARLLREKKNADFAEILEAFAILNVTLADTAIACWDSKYHYRFWRPEDAIRQLDENDWKPHLESPPHPEYVSGHSSFAGAGAFILAQLFESDEIHFKTTSDSLPDIVRNYESFSGCAEEMGRSRIFGGIHFSFSDREGRRLGRRVADYCWKKLHRAKESPLAEDKNDR